MFRLPWIATISVAGVTMAAAAYAQQAQFGSAADAGMMLDKVVASIKSDPAKAIAQINKGEGGFKDRELYPTCAGPNGRNIAHPDSSRIGLIQKDIKDVTGKPYGAEFAAATEGKVSEVGYMFPRPGGDKTPVQKIGLVTRIDGYICLVGYYR
jgi:hypothetical protein